MEWVLEARQDDTLIIKYPRVSEKEIKGEKNRERTAPPRDFRNLTPTPDLAVT